MLHWLLHASDTISSANDEADPAYGSCSGIARATAVFTGCFTGTTSVSCAIKSEAG